MEKFLALLMENPETVIDVIKGGIDKYKPLVYDLLHEVVKICDDYADNKECPMVVAKAKKNMFDAYVAVGFTEDQAMALMLNDNLQLVKNLRESAANVSKTSSK